MNVQEKVAVITGAGSGIGQATAVELAERGVKAIGLVDRSETVLRVAGQINDLRGGPIAEAMVGDATDPEFRKRTFDLLCAKYGAPGILVPAAGITRDQLSVKIDKETNKAVIYPQESFRQVMEVNLMAPVYWALEMVARIAESRLKRGLKRWHPEEGIQGTIIFIGSVSSQGNPGQLAYAATKAGLEGVASTLAKEGRFYGVRCAVIHPGFTDTPMVRALGEDFIKEHILPHTQLGRLIQPEEIADAIYFMLSNSAVSGELWADAGWHPTA
jgi:NAD(P)-dependent dehydrogenase (short-subunit alcohol dehydrogenase family)